MMKRMIAAVIAGLLMIGLTALIAQPRSQRSPKERTDRLKEQLSLNDEQAAKILEIYKNSEKEIAKLREENDGNGETMMKAMQDRTEKSDAAIEKILTDEQKEKFIKIKEERRNRMQNRQRSR